MYQHPGHRLFRRRALERASDSGLCLPGNASRCIGGSRLDEGRVLLVCVGEEWVA
jgi:hypothetical protein